MLKEKVDNIAIGNRLRGFREEKGYSKEYFSKILGMTVGNYRKIESGKVALTIYNISILCEAFEHLDVLWLLTGEHSKIKLFGREFTDEKALWNETTEEEKDQLAYMTAEYFVNSIKKKFGVLETAEIDVE